MDNELFWKLLKPVHPQAAAFCRKLAGDRETGDDLYQESLLSAMRKLNRLKEVTAFRPWLYRIMVNCFINQRRSLRRRRELLHAGAAESAVTTDPRGSYESRRRVQQLLTLLKPEDRAIIILYEIEGWPVGDLAGMFNKPAGTIKTRLARARRTMRKALEKQLSAAKPVPAEQEGLYALPRCKTTD